MSLEIEGDTFNWVGLVISVLLFGLGVGCAANEATVVSLAKAVEISVTPIQLVPTSVATPEVAVPTPAPVPSATPAPEPTAT